MHVIAGVAGLREERGWTCLLNTMPVSRAARLVAISREAKAQSEAAIRCSLRLLRQSAYPEDRAAAGRPRPLDDHTGPTRT